MVNLLVLVNYLIVLNMTSAIKRSTLLKKVKSKSMDISGPSVLDLPVLRRKRTLALNRMRKALEIAELVKSNTSDLNTFRAYYILQYRNGILISRKHIATF